MKKLSVIIPVYNTSKYIRKCLESILAQNFQDVEIICVDDGSTDDSLKILQEYSDRISILKQENLGSGVARNLALQKAQGEYVLFVDSDDWLLKDTFSTIIKTALNTKAEVVIFGGLTYSKSRLRKGSYSYNKIPHKYHNKISNKHTFKNDIFKFPSTAWTKLYKKDFLIKNNIKFQEIFVGQDQLFFIKTMLCADSIYVLTKNFYCYSKKRLGSVTSAKKKTSFSPIDVFWAVNETLSTYNYKILNRYFLKATFWLPKMQDDLKEEYYKRYSEILKFLQTKYPACWWKYLQVEKDSLYFNLHLKYLICCIKYFVKRTKEIA